MTPFLHISLHVEKGLDYHKIIKYNSLGWKVI